MDLTEFIGSLGDIKKLGTSKTNEDLEDLEEIKSKIDKYKLKVNSKNIEKNTNRVIDNLLNMGDLGDRELDDEELKDMYGLSRENIINTINNISNYHKEEISNDYMDGDKVSLKIFNISVRFYRIFINSANSKPRDSIYSAYIENSCIYFEDYFDFNFVSKKNNNMLYDLDDEYESDDESDSIDTEPHSDKDDLYIKIRKNKTSIKCLTKLIELMYFYEFDQGHW